MNYINLFINYLENIKQYSPNTIIGYNEDIKDYMNFLKKEKLEIKYTTYDDAIKYISNLYEKKMSRNSISRMLSSLRKYYKFLVKEKILKENIFEDIKNPKKNKSLPNFINESELDIMFDSIELISPLGQRNRLILEMLYATGVRVSELVNIKITDIDYYNMSIKVLGKGSKERYVFYGSFCEDILSIYIEDGRKKLLDKEKNDYLYLNRYGSKLSVRSIRNIINNIIDNCHLEKKVSPHTFRHTFATHMLNEGANLVDVKELLGHDSIETTSIYTHVSDEKIKEVYYKFHPRAKDDE